MEWEERTHFTDKKSGVISVFGGKHRIVTSRVRILFFRQKIAFKVCTSQYKKEKYRYDRPSTEGRAFDFKNAHSDGKTITCNVNQFLEALTFIFWGWRGQQNLHRSQSRSGRLERSARRGLRSL